MRCVTQGGEILARWGVAADVTKGRLALRKALGWAHSYICESEDPSCDGRKMPAELLISCSWDKDGFVGLVFELDGAHIADMCSDVGYKFLKGALGCWSGSGL